MKLKHIISIILTSVLFFSIMTFFQLKSYGYFENSNAEVGSKIGNIYNGGMAAEDKQYIYFSNYDKEGKIYRMDKKTNKITKVCNDVARYINISSGYIYYSNLSDGEKIYKIKANGQEREKLGDNSTEHIRVKGNFIYYSNVDDGNCLYKMNIHGGKNRKIINESIHLFNLVNDKIYYLRNESIYSTSINGHFKTRVYRANKLVDPVFFQEDIQIVGNNIYFSNKGYDNKDKFLCKANIDDFKAERLTDENVKDINVSGENIYYINEFDGDSLYSMKIDGSNRKKIKEGPMSKINVVGDYIFCFKDVHNEIYRMNIKNGEKEKISKANPSDAYLYNGNIIYTADTTKNIRRGNLNLIDIKSKKEKMLSFIEDGWQKIISIDNNWVYFIQDSFKKDKLIKKLYGVNLNQNNEKEIISELNQFNGKIKDGYLYRVINSNQDAVSIFKQGVGSNKMQKILEIKNDFFKTFYSNSNVTINEITKEWIYYSINYEVKDSKISSNLYRCKLNGDSNELISNDRVNNLLKYNDKLYYSDLSDSGTLYSMNLDGKNKVRVLNGKLDKVYLLTINDDWIYYKSLRNGNRIYKVTIDGKENQRIFNDRDIVFIGVENNYIYYEYALKNDKQYIIRNKGI